MERTIAYLIQLGLLTKEERWRENGDAMGQFCPCGGVWYVPASDVVKKSLEEILNDREKRTTSRRRWSLSSIVKHDLTGSFCDFLISAVQHRIIRMS